MEGNKKNKKEGHEVRLYIQREGINFEKSSEITIVPIKIYCFDKDVTTINTNNDSKKKNKPVYTIYNTHLLNQTRSSQEETNQNARV